MREVIQSVERLRHGGGVVNLKSLDRLYNVKFSAIRDSLDARDKMLDERYATQTVAIATALASADTAVRAALAAAKEAVEKATEALERRLEGVNEFRGQLGDMVNTLMPRSEAEAKFAALSEKFDIALVSIAADRSALITAMSTMDTRLTAAISAMDVRMSAAQSREVAVREAHTDVRADSQHTLAYVTTGFSVLFGVVGIILATYFGLHR